MWEGKEDESVGCRLMVSIHGVSADSASPVPDGMPVPEGTVYPGAVPGGTKSAETGVKYSTPFGVGSEEFPNPLRPTGRNNRSAEIHFRVGDETRGATPSPGKAKRRTRLGLGDGKNGG